MKKTNEVSTMTKNEQEMKVIHVLPELPDTESIEDFKKAFNARWGLAKTTDYTPDSIQTVQAIDYMDVKILMLQNMNFYNAVISLCSDIVEEMIAFTKQMTRSKKVQKAKTLDEILKSGYYGPTYEIARHEFSTLFVEDFLYNYCPKENNISDSAL